MIKKENRMRTRFQFNITRNKGMHQRGSYFHIFMFRPEGYNDATQFGIVVSQKAAKKAVERNRIKRLYRESILSNLEKFPKNSWIVIQPTALSLGKTYEEINTDLIESIQKIPFTD